MSVDMMRPEQNIIKQLKHQVSVVLICTSHSGNIGAVARAMKNMGLYRLILVSPNDFPSEQAYSRSSGAEDVLKQARVVESLDQAIGESQIVIGASARTRKMNWPLITPHECAKIICSQLDSNQQASDQGANVALLFGREASGLTNEELQRCNYHVNIPANEEYSSLNLAMAVQVICYEIRMAALNTGVNLRSLPAELAQQREETLANVSDVEGFLSHLESTLIEIGYHDPNNPRMLMSRLRRLFQRAHLDKMEVNILRGILKDVTKLTKQR